jgi:hypothetical protein
LSKYFDISSLINILEVLVDFKECTNSCTRMKLSKIRWLSTKPDFSGETRRGMSLEIGINDFGDDFINDIAQRNGSKFPGFDHFFLFWNQNKESSIESWEDP